MKRDESYPFTCIEIESLVARKWNIRQNIIVPNVSWGLNIHECDLLIVSKSNWATEIEIKIIKSDLKKDLEKKHSHKSKRIKYLYFAIPEKLENCIGLIPEHAGVIVAKKTKNLQCNYSYVDIIREPKRNEDAIKITEDEIKQLSRLGCMRIWTLKQTVIGLMNDNRYLRNSLQQHEREKILL